MEGCKEWSTFCTVLLGTLWWAAQGMLRGQRINSVAYPWLAGLLEERTWLARCSGAVIHPHFVLTASSCFLQPGTLDEIEKNNYVIVVPTRVNQVRKIDLLIFPNRSVFDYRTAGLIGVKKAFNMQTGGATNLSIWSWDARVLREEFNYVFDNAGFLSCTVITWKDEPRVTHSPIRKKPKSENFYEARSVSAAEVQLVYPDVCRAKLCSKFAHQVDCEILLNKSMCVKVVDPPSAYLCGADEGASVTCNDFTWGLLVGEVKCKSAPQNHSEQYPLFFRMDYAVDFLQEHKDHYPPDDPDMSFSHLPGPGILLSVQYMVFLLKFYRFILFLE